MKKTVLVVRILLGFIFFIFGLNGILHFLPTPPMPPGDAATFATILTVHKYMSFVALCQIIGGLLLLVGRYVPLGLTILGPIVVNILLYHFLLEPKGMIIGLLATALEVFLIYAYRLSFRGLFDANPETL